MARARAVTALGLVLGLAVVGAGGGIGDAAARPGRAPAPWQTLPEVPALPEPTAAGDVAVDGATIHFASFGQGPPVVLLHGGCGHGGQLGFQVPALATDHQVIVVDARGQGHSGVPRGGLSYAAMADDVVAVLDHLAVDKVAVVGWSDGAIVGLELAMRHGDRVRGVFALAANLDRSGTTRPSNPALMTSYYARCRREQAALQPDRKQRAAARAALSAMWKREPRIADDRVRAIAVPLTVAIAEHDELIRADHARHIAALVSGAQVVELHGVSHFALWQDPVQANAAVRAFLAALPADR